MSQALLLFHSPCTDGAYAALAMYLGLKTRGVESIFVPHLTNVAIDPDALRAQHPSVELEVYLLDYCGPSVAFINRLCELFKKVHLLDHHLTAQDMVRSGLLHKDLRVVVDMNRSGATIALDESGLRDSVSPELLKIYAYVEDNDLWRHDDVRCPGSKQFTAGLNSLRINTDFAANPAAIDQLWELDFDAVMKLGAPEMERTRALIADYVEKRYHVMLPGQVDYTIAVDIEDGDYGIISQLGHVLAVMSASDMGAVVTRQGGNAKVSMRSVKGVDTTVVSKQFGGGGHAGSSGFNVPHAEWLSFKH